MVHKVVRGKSSDNLTIKYKGFNGRPEDSLMLEAPSANTKHGRRMFSYNGPRLWNALPVDIREEEDTERFKKSVKTLLYDGHEALKRKAYKYMR